MDEIKNTLLIGNGFNRAVYPGAPDWGSLYGNEQERLSLSNYTFLYEAGLLNTDKSDNQYKRRIADELRLATQVSKINYNINGIEIFGNLLEKHNISELITTNVDKGIENVLTGINGFAEEWPESIEQSLGEKIYSIRRNVNYKCGDFKLRIWKIHGDIDNIASISLGFDQYCGSLAKMKGYMNGEYDLEEDYACKISILEKFNKPAEEASNRVDQLDDISWIELFFKTNVYIACFGMDFSEIDIWWLLNKRCRLIKLGVPINNKIVFLYNEYDTGDPVSEKEVVNEQKKKVFQEKLTLLKIFGVECRKIDAGMRCLTSLFEQIPIA